VPGRVSRSNVRMGVGKRNRPSQSENLRGLRGLLRLDPAVAGTQTRSKERSNSLERSAAVPGRVSRSNVLTGEGKRNRPWQCGTQRALRGLLRLVLTDTGALQRTVERLGKERVQSAHSSTARHQED
jgi:hypothetical protein